MSSITSDCLFGADARKAAGARQLGEMLLKGLRGRPGQMSKSMLAGHLQAAIGGNGRDFGRVAAVRDPTGAFSKSAALIAEAERVDRLPRGEIRELLEKRLEREAEELAAHLDRPSRDNALSAAQHREIAREHEAAKYESESVGNLTVAAAHESAALAHHRAAHLASSHDSELPFASHRAREATRRCNRVDSRQIDLPHPHANKGAGDGFSAPAGHMRDTRSSDPFRSQPVDDRQFREPHGNTRAFRESGRVFGGGPTAREGYEYPADAPASPMERLFGPPQNALWMNWNATGRDPDYPDNQRAQGRAGPYDASGPEKVAGYDPRESLSAMSKRMLSGSSIAKSLDLAHSLTVAGRLPETCYRAILKMRDLKVRMSKAAFRNLQADDEYREVVDQIVRSPISVGDRETLLMSIA